MDRFIFIVCITVSLIASTYGNSAELPGKVFFHSLPKNVQPHYLRYELAKGWTMSILNRTINRTTDEEIILPDDLNIPENLLIKFKTFEVPDNFTENLLNFVRTNLGLNEASIRNLILTRIVCFEGSICLDLSDIGSICCPF